jgi:hypothetical protein
MSRHSRYIIEKCILVHYFFDVEASLDVLCSGKYLQPRAASVIDPNLNESSW